MTLHVGFSKDGLKWDMNPDTIKFEGAAPEVAEWGYGYDPRVAEIDGRYYVSWCNDHHGPTIGLAWTDDFCDLPTNWRMPSCPYNRNGVLFPKKINGRFCHAFSSFRHGTHCFR